ncbi:MAG TPA: hypothetical protein VH879_05150 [Gemmatimonadales bacterium]
MANKRLEAWYDVIPRRSFTCSFLALCLLGSAACYHGPAATAPPAIPTLTTILDTVSPGTPIRLATTQTHFQGRLVALSVDSVRLRGTAGDTSFARAQIDTLWLRGRQSYDGTKAGAAAGLLLALLPLLARSRGGQPESTGDAALLAAYLAGGALALGILIDIATPAPWVPVEVH